nr:MAG TPA: hypothetical protein [Caudoviricetes sp.]
MFNNVNCQFKDTCINGLSQTKCNNCSKNFRVLNVNVRNSPIF